MVTPPILISKNNLKELQDETKSLRKKLIEDSLYEMKDLIVKIIKSINSYGHEMEPEILLGIGGSIIIDLLERYEQVATIEDLCQIINGDIENMRELKADYDNTKNYPLFVYLGLRRPYKQSSKNMYFNKSCPLKKQYMTYSYLELG